MEPATSIKLNQIVRRLFEIEGDQRQWAEKWL